MRAVMFCVLLAFQASIGNIQADETIEPVAKLQFRPKSALLPPSPVPAQIAYGQSDMSICAERGLAPKSSNLCKEASFATGSIDVHKKGVLHKFVRFDERTDHFTQHHFQEWENDTFEVFDKVKDPQSIAIDLGAWIGTTSIWLSKNFYHVIAVEADKESLNCLQRNLEASECENVTICNKPVSNLAQEVIFGTRGNYLNESISCIKTKVDNISDYSTRSITFKQLVFDYVYADEGLYSDRIGFIKCDIEGGEETILEDLLHFAYYNKCKAYISFHLDWWKNKKINDFAYLFEYFNTNCPITDVCEYLKQRPFSSLLFEPIDGPGVLYTNNLKGW